MFISIFYQSQQYALLRDVELAPNNTYNVPALLLPGFKSYQGILLQGEAIYQTEVE